MSKEPVPTFGCNPVYLALRVTLLPDLALIKSGWSVVGSKSSTKKNIRLTATMHLKSFEKLTSTRISPVVIRKEGNGDGN